MAVTDIVHQLVKMNAKKEKLKGNHNCSLMNAFFKPIYLEFAIFK